MHIWKDANGALITDEQLVRYIATFGSLSAALAAGDVTLVIDEKPPARPAGAPRPSLKELMEEEA